MEDKTLLYVSARLVFLCLLVSATDCAVNRTTGNIHNTSAPLEARNQTEEYPAVTFEDAISSRNFDDSEIITAPNEIQQKKHVVKRHVQEIESETKCNEIHTPSSPGDHEIREIRQHGYTFFFKPLKDFQNLIFNMMIDNNFDANKPYRSDENINLSKSDFEDNKSNEWIEIKVEYFKHVVHGGRDKLALRVTMMNRTYPLISARWWRTHTYEGFLISTKGRASFLFDCVSSALPSTSISIVNKPLLLGGILGVSFLLVIAGWVWYLFIRRHPRQPGSTDHPPVVPPLPASLLLNKGEKNPYPEHIYEEFDEETLARLRQKMNPETLGKYDVKGRTPQSQTHHDVLLRTRTYMDAASSEGQKICGISHEPVYLNEMNMSIIEQKLKASCRDSTPESHYVEMHGILNTPPKDAGQ